VSTVKLVDVNRNLRWVCADCRGALPRAAETPVDKPRRCTLCGTPSCAATSGSFVQFRTVQEHGDFVARRIAELTAPGVTARCVECGALGFGADMGAHPLCADCYDISEDGFLWPVKLWAGRVRRWWRSH